MDGFSFPPPPPPPPKAASSAQSEAPNQFNNRGGRGGGRGRGARGSFRGRGGAPNRGGGANYQHQNTNNPGYGQNAGNYQSNYGNQQQQYPQQYHSGQQYPGPQQYHAPQQYQAPPGSYINPAFANVQAQGYPQPQIPQYGHQSGLAAGQSNPPSYGNHSNANSPPGKRTRDQAFGNSNRVHPMKKPSSGPKAQVAPSVPSFGAPLLPAKPPAPLSSEGGLKPRPQTNLGLIPSAHDPQESDPEDDEDEEVDEEAALSALSNGPLSFEFNGELSTLGSSADIAEWIEERKKRWPSKRRVEEKEQEVQSRMQERRRIEQETRAAIAVASGGEYQPVERRDIRQHREMEQPASERLAKEDGDSMMEDTQEQLNSATQQTDQPIATDPTVTLPKDDQHRSDSDSDAPPEVTSSKPFQPVRIPPPSTASNTHSKPATSEAKPCISFVNQGRCKFGNKCRYKHDSAASGGQDKGKRKTLFQRVSGFPAVQQGTRRQQHCANANCTAC